MRVAKETHKFLIGGVCAESAKKMKFFFSPYLTEEFPIWWGREPSVIDTFLDAHDFTGKTIVPFCTSGGSGIGETAKRMQEIVGASAVVKEGTRLGGTVSEADLAIWTSELGL